MYLDTAEQQLRAAEQGEWVRVTARAKRSWLKYDGFCPWHIAFRDAGLPIENDRCHVGWRIAVFSNNRIVSVPFSVTQWICDNDVGHNPPPHTIEVNRRTLEMRDVE